MPSMQIDRRTQLRDQNPTQMEHFPVFMNEELGKNDQVKLIVMRLPDW